MILDASEKLGGNAPDTRSISDFQLAVTSSGLTDIGFVGSSFTWSNNQQGASAICARLDRCFANHAFLC